MRDRRPGPGDLLVPGRRRRLLPALRRGLHRTPTTVRLTRNYRSGPPSSPAALQAIAPSTLVAGRELAGAAGPRRPGPDQPSTRRPATWPRPSSSSVPSTGCSAALSFRSLDSGRADGGADARPVVLRHRRALPHRRAGGADGRGAGPGRHAGPEALARPAARPARRPAPWSASSATPAPRTGAPAGRRPRPPRSLAARLAAAPRRPPAARPPGRTTGRPWSCSPRWPRAAATTWTGSWPSWPPAPRSTPRPARRQRSRC